METRSKMAKAQWWNRGQHVQKESYCPVRLIRMLHKSFPGSKRGGSTGVVAGVAGFSTGSDCARCSTFGAGGVVGTAVWYLMTTNVATTVPTITTVNRIRMFLIFMAVVKLL